MKSNNKLPENNRLLESNRIILRAMEPSDIELLYKWENDKSIWVISNTFAPFSKYILTKYIENSHQDIYQAKQLRLMIDIKKQSGNTTIGAIDIFDFEPYHLRAGLGILISEKQNRKKGYASESIEIIIDYAFNYLGLKQLFCNIGEDNKDSIDLFEKHGFKKCGEKKFWIKKQGKWINELMFQLINI